MATNSRKCGPNATEEWDGYPHYRSHYISGEGSITSCYAIQNSNDEDFFTIHDGITELCDGCFNYLSVSSVSLPSTLETIGDNCFKDSKLTRIKLPESLKRIGHNNFPYKLYSLEIPKGIEEFPIDNVIGCRDLVSITVNEDNNFYKSKEGILYNHDMTEILFCPNAKEGKVIIPNTVTRIGEYCFAGCQKLDMIIIPTSVVELGDYAFQRIKIKKLNIRNSVRFIGKYCFEKAEIAEEFKFSKQVYSLPEGIFDEFKCASELCSFNQFTHIGKDALNNCSETFIPKLISLSNAKEIQSDAFSGIEGKRTIELFASLEKLEDGVFGYTDDNLIIRYFSYAPMRISEDTFGNLGKNATLVVPKGTKIVYENTSPWMSFPHIEEWDAGVNRNEEGEFTPISDEIYCKRLQSIIESKREVDRFYLREIFSELMLSYLYVNSDEEYEEALSLICYNRSFSPVIVPDFEKKIWSEWSNKYKLKLLNDCVIEGSVSQLVIAEQKEIDNLPLTVETQLPITQLVEIPSSQDNTKYSSVEAYFNTDILKHLQNSLELAKQSVKIAVSWFTNYGLYKQVGQMAEDGIKVQLIINNDRINNGGYCLNFNELISKGVKVSLVEYPHLLHHKFVIIDDNLLITGSYNWTRFSGKNYENMVVINDQSVIEQFSNEFDELLENAEHKCIDKMPDYVKDQPEYDRSAFKQYITEELDAQARESSNERDKITALKKAVELNPEYLEKINPGIQQKYNEAFKVIEGTTNIQEFIVNTVNQIQVQKTNKSSLKNTSKDIPVANSTNEETKGKALTRQQESIIDNIKASGLTIVLDVSGSMSDTYNKGHVYEITKKALSASLALTKEQEVGVWTFGDSATFIGNFGLNQIDQIHKITCQNQGTYLQRFVEKANDSIKDGSLCIIFTDDDSSSISAAIGDMKKREKVFWQIIAYESDVKGIKAAISNVENTSVVTLSDYKNRTDKEISELLLKDYLVWRSK